jgi:N6-adenosine-specific RNA methylase IME4
MTQLTRYESAKAALAEARRIDEVKTIRDKAEAIRAYARMAHDTQLEMDAAELRLRAERRLGIMLKTERDAGRLKPGVKKDRKSKGLIGAGEAPISLQKLGIDKKLSARSQRVGGIAERAFEQMLKQVRTRIEHHAGRVSLDVLQADKKGKRADKERALAKKQAALPDKRYGVILADPEWKHKPWSDTGMAKSADNHYPTSDVDEIARRPVEKIAAKDCVLFLWATVPMLPEALDVLRAWGFTYKSHAVWKKIYPGKRQGMGYWFRINHEILLVGTRGNIPCPAPGENWGSVIEAPIGAHSEKPAKSFELIEAYFPNLPKIELNARKARKGWDAWGLEAPVDSGGKPISHDKSTGEVTDAEAA